MSGSDLDVQGPAILQELTRVLDRQVPLSALDRIYDSFDDSSFDLDQKSVAFGLDANVLLRLSGAPKREDVLDYWSSKNNGPLILPGQSIQEFWNNQLKAVDTVAKKLRSKYKDLKEVADEIDWINSDFQEKLDKVISEFEDDYGHVFDEKTKERTQSLFEYLKTNARSDYVPRSQFVHIESIRAGSKTPPGFEDSKKHGDFFIWADFLYSLKIEVNEGSQFDAIVFVTNEKKIDWQLNGRPHPVLCAEVWTLFGKPLILWDLNTLQKKVDQALNG